MPTEQMSREWELESEKWPDHKNPSSYTRFRNRVRNRNRIDEKLEAEIEQARNLLQLADNWDGEGSPAYSIDTFNRTVEFLTLYAEHVRSHDYSMPVPIIGAAQDGSIDVHWKRQSWELLVNIPADLSEMAAYYGDDYGVQKNSGRFDSRTLNYGILAWLMQ